MEPEASPRETPDGTNRTTAARVVKIVSASLLASICLSMFTAVAGMTMYATPLAHAGWYSLGNLLAVLIIAEIHRARRSKALAGSFAPACIGIAFTSFVACVFAVKLWHQDVIGFIAPFFFIGMVLLSILFWYFTSLWLFAVVRRAYA